jgi:hypothetical protein
MIFIITDVIPKVLKKIVVALSEIIYKMFDDITKKMPEGPLKSTMQFIQKGFGEDGILTKFFSKLADWFPGFIVMLAVVTALGKLVPILKAVGSLISFIASPKAVMFISKILWPLISGILTVLWTGLVNLTTMVIVPLITFIGSLLLAVWPIIAIGAALFLLWKYAEKISDFFDGLIDRFKKMSGWMKTLVVVLSIIAAPITLFIASIYAIVKLFKSFKKIGVANTFKAMGKGIVNMAKGAKEWASSKIGAVGDWLTEKSKKARENIGAGINWVAGIATKLKEAIIEVWQKYILTAFSGWFESLQYQFYQFLERASHGFIGHKEESSAIAFYRSKGLSEPEAEEQFKKISANSASKEAFYQMVAKVTGVPLNQIAEGNDQIVKAIDALRNNMKSGQILKIDKSRAFDLSVVNIK